MATKNETNNPICLITYNELQAKKLFEDISGVSKAFQGRNVSAGTSASLYETEARNASIALTDIFETFATFRHQRDKKIVESWKMRVRVLGEELWFKDLK